MGNTCCGIDRIQEFASVFSGKRLGLVTGGSGIGRDYRSSIEILRESYQLTTLFSPEHGVRGELQGGVLVDTHIDAYSGLPAYSLFADSIDTNVKSVRDALYMPSQEALDRVDAIVFDIQDVGSRYYTFPSTLFYIMKACAKAGKECIVLDRPNPIGGAVEGNCHREENLSFIGLTRVPIRHGMTLGELALMINGEGWLKEGRKCNLTVVPCKGYTHQTRYKLPVIPSPNLPNMTSIYLYPSLCYFEATNVSLGRGTDKPFQQFGHPNMKGYDYSFTPESREGAKNPPQLGHKCFGRDLSGMSDDEIIAKQLDLSYLIEAYRSVNEGDKFFTSFFEKLIGVDWVRTMIEEGKSAEEISQRWKPDVEKFKQQSRKYLLYK